MKKTLIASAVLLASGAVFAQASITGSFIYGYKATTSAKANNPQAAGMGVDTSEIDLAVKEDLGGGQTVEAKMAFAGADRSGESTSTAGNGNVKGRDASLTYTNSSIGQFKFSTAEGGDYFNAIATVGAPVIEMDGKLHETKSSSDHASYTVPVGPTYFNVDFGEPSAGMGLGAGMQGTANPGKDQRNITYSLYYPAGSLTVLGAYRNYNNRQDGACQAGATSMAQCPAIYATKNDLLNLQMAYDFGVAKLGLGYQSVAATNGITQLDTMIAVSVPMGAWTIGAAWSQSKLSNAPDTTNFVFGTWDARKYEGSAYGASYGVSYAFSKRTSVTLKYATWNHSGYSQYEADAAANAIAYSGNGAGGLSYNRNANEGSLLLSHTF